MRVGLGSIKKFKELCKSTGGFYTAFYDRNKYKMAKQIINMRKID